MYRLRYHPKVADDLRCLPRPLVRRFDTALQTKLLTDPLGFGKPLRNSLKGMRTLRLGDWRAVYTISGREVIIYIIYHRRAVYDEAVKRVFSSLL